MERRGRKVERIILPRSAEAGLRYRERNGFSCCGMRPRPDQKSHYFDVAVSRHVSQDKSLTVQDIVDNLNLEH